MPQENNNIENNFSTLENEAEADLSQIDAHWAQMKNTLTMHTANTSIPKKWLWASVPIICTIVLLFFFVNKKNNNNEKPFAENLTVIKENKIFNDTATVQIKSIDTIKQSNVIAIPKKRTVIFSTQKNKFTTSKSLNKTPPNVILNYEVANNEKVQEIKVVNISTPQNKDSSKIDKDLEQKQKLEILNDFITKIKKKGELFTINNLRDTTIKAAEGTVFYIPMNTFNTKDSVVFEVKEFYKYSDMIANGLTTMADDKQLISGGMLSLTAKVKGNEVAMNPSKEIRVFIPNLTAKDSMEIFEGKKKETQDFYSKNTNIMTQNNINWQLSKVRIDSAVLKMFIRAIDLKDDHIEYTTTYNNKTKAVFRRAIASSFSKSELLVILRKKYGDYYDKIRVHNQWKHDLLFRNNESLEEEYYHLAYNSWGVGDTAELLPSTIRIYKLKPIDTVYKVYKWITKGYATINKPYLSSNTLSLIGEKYSIGISKLGWINCDRFNNYRGKKSDFIIDLKDSANSYFTYLVFDKYKSIMTGQNSGNMVVFPNIPVGAYGRIISVGIKNGKTISAMKRIKTSTSILSDLPFEETSPKIFKDSLKDLDNRE
jgi:hypothetical protein